MELSREYFIAEGYLHARQLEDGTWVGIEELIFYTSIYVGLNASGWAKRYDYKYADPVMVEQYHKLKTFDDIPIGWVSKRPK